jgi:F-type H+-transporting ATPase subunit c
MNPVRKLGLALLTMTFCLALAFPALAQPIPAQPIDEKAQKQELERIEAKNKGPGQAFGSPSWGAGIGAGLVIIGAALGFGRIGAAALESMARQPETAGRVQTAMIIIGALLEGATFFALIICIIVAGRAN